MNYCLGKDNSVLDSNTQKSILNDYYSPKKIKEFAEYLWLEGDLHSAIIEYQRLYFHLEDSVEKQFVSQRIGAAFLEKTNYSEAEKWLHLSLEQNQLVIYPKAIAKLAYSRWKQGKVEEAFQTFNTYQNENLARYHFLLNQLHFYETGKYYSAFDAAVSKENQLLFDSSEIKKIVGLAKEGKNLSLKSPIFAGILSSIIPGTGRIYVGRFRDGITSMILIGFFSWQAFDGFSKSGVHSPKGWIFSTIGSGFYLGEIYGAAVSANIRNTAVRNNFWEKASFQIEVEFK